MARIRTIKPDFFTDAKITSLTPLARLFYVSLWCEADREGRFEWDPETLKTRYVPRDKCDVGKLADELTAKGRLKFYKVGDKVFCWLPTFAKNQVINNREAPSSIPAYTDDACVSRESGVKAEGRKEGKGKEGKEGTLSGANASEPEKFSELMEAFPKRIGTNPRPRALKAWEAAVKRGADPDQMIAAAKAYARSEAAGTRWCMQTVTWLNGDCWAEATASPPQAQTDPAMLQWKSRLTAKIWNTDQWGPPPGSPGCKVPKELLTEAA